MGRLTEFIYGSERGSSGYVSGGSTRRGRTTRTTSLKLNLDPKWIEKVYDKINPVLEEGAKILMRDAKANAPYDPKSRRANGKRKKTDNFPTVHHRDSIYMGLVNDKKRREKAGNVRLFFDTKPGLLKSYFVRSSSNRGFWLEKGTKGLSAGQAITGENYGALIDAEKTKKGRARTAGLIKRQLAEIGKGGKPHYATPKQPHFLPAYRKAAKYIKTMIRSIV